MGACLMILTYQFCLLWPMSLGETQIRPWPLTFGQAPGSPGPPGSSESHEDSSGLTIMRPNRVLSIQAPMSPHAHLSQPSNIFASVWAPWSTWGFCVDGRQIRVRACNTIAGFRCYGTNMETRSCEASNVNTQSRSIFNNIFGTDGAEVTRAMAHEVEFKHWTTEKVPQITAPPRRPRPQLLPYPAQSGGLSWPVNSNNLQPFSYIENQQSSLLNVATAAPVIQTSYPASNNNADSSLYLPPLNLANDAAWWSQWSDYSVCNCGTRSRTRTCDVTNVYLSNGCPGPSYQLLPCDDGGKCSGRKPQFLSCADGGCGGQGYAVQPPVVPRCNGLSCGQPRVCNGAPCGSFQPPTIQSCTNGQCGGGGQASYGGQQSYNSGRGYGYYKPYTAPPSGPALFNIWMDAVWQPTAQWKAVATTVAPFVDGYGNVVQPGTESTGSVEQMTTVAGPVETTVAPVETTFETPTAPPKADTTTTSGLPLAGKQNDLTTVAGSTTTEESDYEEEEETTAATLRGKSTLPPPPPPPKGWKGLKAPVNKQKSDKLPQKISMKGAKVSPPR